MSNPFSDFEHQIQEEKNQIKVLKALLTRAADALDLKNNHGRWGSCSNCLLIQDLWDATK